MPLTEVGGGVEQKKSKPRSKLHRAALWNAFRFNSEVVKRLMDPKGTADPHKIYYFKRIQLLKREDCLKI